MVHYHRSLFPQSTKFLGQKNFFIPILFYIVLLYEQYATHTTYKTSQQSTAKAYVCISWLQLTTKQSSSG